MIEFGSFRSKRSASARASEDFMPNEPTFQTLHVAAVAFNSLLLGEIVVPDWDMFYVILFSLSFLTYAIRILLQSQNFFFCSEFVFNPPLLSSANVLAIVFLL